MNAHTSERGNINTGSDLDGFGRENCLKVAKLAGSVRSSTILPMKDSTILTSSKSTRHDQKLSYLHIFDKSEAADKIY